MNARGQIPHALWPRCGAVCGDAPTRITCDLPPGHIEAHESTSQRWRWATDEQASRMRASEPAASAGSQEPWDRFHIMGITGSQEPAPETMPRRVRMSDGEVEHLYRWCGFANDVEAPLVVKEAGHNLQAAPDSAKDLEALRVVAGELVEALNAHKVISPWPWTSLGEKVDAVSRLLSSGDGTEEREQ